jgi:hypothetical protein
VTRRLRRHYRNEPEAKFCAPLSGVMRVAHSSISESAGRSATGTRSRRSGLAGRVVSRQGMQKRAAQSSEVIPSPGLLVQGGGDAVQSDLEGVRAEAFDGDEHGERGDEGG